MGVLWAHGAATLLGARVRRRHCLSAATTPAGPPQALDARLSLLLWANLASHVALTAREVHFHVTFPLNYPLTFSVDFFPLTYPLTFEMRRHAAVWPLRLGGAT